MSKSNYPEIFRKRYIPAETVHLADDKILELKEKRVVTKWNALKPRKDISHGISAYIIDKGYKVSKIFDHNNKLVYWYCDIIRTIKYPDQSKIIFEDLLLDVLIHNDGRSEILDLGELLNANANGVIPQALFFEALNKLNTLLDDIYSGEIKQTLDLIESFE